MDITAIIRLDRDRLVSGIVCKAPENARELRHKSCPARMIRRYAPSGQRSLQHAESITSRRKMRNKRILRQFSEAIVAGWFSRNHPKPQDFQQDRVEQEKRSRDWTPSGVKRPGKTHVPGGPNRPRLHRMGVKTGHNGSQDRVTGCGGRGPGRGGSWVFGVSIQDRRSELNFHQLSSRLPSPHQFAEKPLPAGFRGISIRLLQFHYSSAGTPVNSPNLCRRCSRPLFVGSADGVCLMCRLADTSVTSLTPQSLLRVGAATRSGVDPDGPTRSQPYSRVEEAESDAELPPPPLGYDLLRRLGRGGMGEVYLAREHSTERVVAMKFLRDAAGGHGVERFLAEVKALARIDHPNIVRVIAVDTNRLSPLFTMEYAAGGSLARRVERGPPLSPVEAARIIAVVSRAVHAAHQADILHRDLKPSNILLTADGTPKVSDFGLAKRTDVDEGLTQGTGPVGTPAFMPPEQISRKYGDPGPASDVYGLGATLYHLLTGRPPFVGDTPQDIITQVESLAPARPKSLQPGLPIELEGIVVKCLEKNPRSRYESAEALAADLDRFLSGATPIAPPLTRVRRVRRWVARNLRWLALAAVAFMTAVLLFGLGMRMAPVPPELPPPDPLQEFREQLVAGQPATIIGPTGLPRSHRFRFFPSTLGLSPQGDNACSFQSQDLTLLELLPDPGIDRYRIRAEIMHLSSSGQRPPGAQQGLESVGLYFGGDSLRIADGREGVAILNVFFNDCTPNPPAGEAPIPQEVRFQPIAVLPAVGPNKEFGPGQFRAAGESLIFKPTRVRPGPWRFITIDVAPEAISVHWQATAEAEPQLLAEWTADEVRSRLMRLQPTLSRAAPQGELQLRPWTPRQAIGIWCYRSGISIRNVVVEPIR